MPKHLTHNDLQMLLAGPAVVGTNAMPPGLYVARATTFTQIVGQLGTAPTGSSLVATLTQAGSTTVLATLTFPAGSASISSTVNLSVPGNSYLQLNVTSVGSTVAGSDLSVSLLGSLT